jgi:hypothetical protein
MTTRIASVVLVLFLLISVALSALVLPPATALPPLAAPAADQDEFEDRPPIIISSGSVILSVAKGTWARQAAGRYRQELPNGKDVKSFSARTGTGTSVCTVAGASLVVRYGANSINVGRVMPAAPAPQRGVADVRIPESAKITARDARTLVIETTDALVSVSNGGTRPQDTCKVVGGRLEIRQVH